MRMPLTAVSMAVVGPPLVVPGFGSNVSNWLGPPGMKSSTHAVPRRRNSSVLAEHAQPGGTDRGAPQERATAQDAVVAGSDLHHGLQHCVSLVAGVQWPAASSGQSRWPPATDHWPLFIFVSETPSS